MFDLPFSAPWALALLGAAIWTTLFSLAQFPLRGLRNFGLLASYIIGLAMAIRLPWREAAVTWAVFGICGGLLYVGYEMWTLSRQPASGERPRLGALLHGLFVWPIMVPEAVEYLLADLGVLAPPTDPPTTPQPTETAGES